MKLSFLAIAAILVTSSAFACPNLTGTYSCTNSDGSTGQMKYTQSETNGITTYVVSNVDGSSPALLIADGQVREMAGTQDPTSKILESYTCENSTVRYNSWIQELDSNGNEISKTDAFAEVISLDANGNIQFTSTEEVITCQKVK